MTTCNHGRRKEREKMLNSQITRSIIPPTFTKRCKNIYMQLKPSHSFDSIRKLFWHIQPYHTWCCNKDLENIFDYNIKFSLKNKCPIFLLGQVSWTLNKHLSGRNSSILEVSTFVLNFRFAKVSTILFDLLVDSGCKHG